MQLKYKDDPQSGALFSTPIVTTFNRPCGLNFRGTASRCAALRSVHLELPDAVSEGPLKTSCRMRPVPIRHQCETPTGKRGRHNAHVGSIKASTLASGARLSTGYQLSVSVGMVHLQAGPTIRSIGLVGSGRDFPDNPAKKRTPNNTAGASLDAVTTERNLSADATRPAPGFLLSIWKPSEVAQHRTREVRLAGS